MKEEQQILPFDEITDAPPTQDDDPFYLEAIQDINAYIPVNGLTCVSEKMLQVARSRSKVGQQVKQASDDNTWLENSGVIARYQTKLAKSPCLAVLMSEYYRAIEKEKKELRIYHKDEDTVNNRPALSAKAGQGSYNKIKEGAYYEQALDLAAGDKQIAMELIGYCGHDDQNQNARTVVSFENDSRAKLLQYMKKSAAHEAKLVGNKLAESMFEIAHQEEIEQIRDHKSADLNIKCPTTIDPFYTPGAIHPQLQLDQAMVDKISRIQAPTQGAGSLPAKNYHLIFAASMGCQLSQCGISEDKAKGMLQLIAKKYRKKRLKSQIAKYKVWKNLIMKNFDVKDWSDPSILTEGFETKVNEWISKNHKELIKKVGPEFFSNNRASIDWKFLIKNIDSAGMFNIRFVDQYLDDPKSFENQTENSIKYCMTLYNDQDRCEGVAAHIHTWLVDFEWTSEQQAKGAKFGFEQCSDAGYTDDQQMEDRACKILTDRYSEYQCTTFSEQ